MEHVLQHTGAPSMWRGRGEGVEAQPFGVHSSLTLKALLLQHLKPPIPDSPILSSHHFTVRDPQGASLSCM